MISAVLNIHYDETEKAKGPPWDLTPYAGLSISLGPARTQFDVGGGRKKFTLILKDDSTSSPFNASEGMKQEASISWEAQFEVPAGDDGKGGEVWLPWGMFNLTYRGRPVNDDGRKLERDKVRQVGIMMRRYVMHLSSRFFLSPCSLLSIVSISSYTYMVYAESQQKLLCAMQDKHEYIPSL